MRTFFDKFFLRSSNLNYFSNKIKNLTNNTPARKIFDAINEYSEESEIRYVGGCVRKIINNEKVDDIDLATNLVPEQVCEVLKKKEISYYESGIEHGTITALVDNYKFEITTLRKDISTDGRHAKVEFTNNWKEDASRRDFTINAIYSDGEGNLFDPYNGKNDLEKGHINFIGDVDKRIQEDYLRILRYIRFFLNYSKQPHNSEISRKFKINIGGVSKLSKERLLDELKKILKLDTLEKLTIEKLSLEMISIIFPELKNYNIFKKLNSEKRNILREVDFIFLLSLMIIDDSDNVDYFFYKYNLSKKDQKRIKIIYNFYKHKFNLKKYTQYDFNEYFYYEGNQAVLDILRFKAIKSKKVDKSLIELYKHYKDKPIPKMPIRADLIMQKYKIPQGKQLGDKLKKIEEEWVKNNFTISEKQVENIIEN